VDCVVQCRVVRQEHEHGCQDPMRCSQPHDDGESEGRCQRDQIHESTSNALRGEQWNSSLGPPYPKLTRGAEGTLPPLDVKVASHLLAGEGVAVGKHPRSDLMM